MRVCIGSTHAHAPLASSQSAARISTWSKTEAVRTTSKPRLRKQRDAPHVGRADAGHESLFPLNHAKLVTRVRQEQDKRWVCTPLAAVNVLCGRLEKIGEEKSARLRRSDGGL